MNVSVVVCLCLYDYRFSRHFPCCKTWWLKNLNLINSLHNGQENNIAQRRADKCLSATSHCSQFNCAPACKYSGLKSADMHACKQHFDGPRTNLLSILCVLIEVYSCGHAKGENAWMISNLSLLLVVFLSEWQRGNHGSERVKRLFCSLIKVITPTICMLCFVLINSVILNILCVWIKNIMMCRPRCEPVWPSGKALGW